MSYNETLTTTSPSRTSCSSSERICISAGFGMVVCLLLGLWPAAGFIPPPAPRASAAEVAAIYDQQRNGIIAGSVLVMMGAAFFQVFCVAVSSAMRRHSAHHDALAQAQLSCATVNTVLFILVGLFWLVAAYRPDLPASEVRLFNDMAWIIMVVPTGPFMIQLIAVGWVVLATPGGLPRWVGFFNLWCALLAIPGMFSGFFKTGPIAWNGILSFWLEASVFLLWLLVMIFALWRYSGRAFSSTSNP